MTDDTPRVAAISTILSLEHLRHMSSMLMEMSKQLAAEADKEPNEPLSYRLEDARLLLWVVAKEYSRMELEMSLRESVLAGHAPGVEGADK